MLTRAVKVESLSEWRDVVWAFKKQGYNWRGDDIPEDVHDFAFTEMRGEVIAILDEELVWGWENDFPYYVSFEEFMKGLQ